MTTETKTHIVFNAPNDRNGNPRRVSILIEDGDIIEVCDHGYSGSPRGWPVSALSQGMTATDYREWLQLGKELAEKGCTP